MADINPAELCEVCTSEALIFGVNPHYLVAVAKLRSGMKDDKKGDLVGPFGLTQAQWEAHRVDAEFEMNLRENDLNHWDLQCSGFALMTLRAQNRLLERLGRFPSALELYGEQWPDDQADLPGRLQQALDDTAALIDPAAVKVLGQPPAESAQIDDVLDAASAPTPERDKPTPPSGDQIFSAKAPRIMAQLMDHFGLSDTMAAGILGNIGHECAGFRLMQEVKPRGGGRGGFGWAQWTGVRRTAFENFCQAQGLLPTSDQANYAFLKLELETTHKAALTAVKGATSLRKAVVEFEKEFERAHKDHKHYDRREEWAQLAIDTFKRTIPAVLAEVLDSDQIRQVAATAKAANTAFWVIDQFSEEGGQILVRRVGRQKPEVLLADSTVFPLPAGLVPADAAATLSKGLAKVAETPTPTPAPAPAIDEEISQRVFAEAKKCNGTLISRNAPNTNGGKLACAWAVNEVFRRAVGKPVGGGLSTVTMSKVLLEKHAALNEAAIMPGAVVISPTQGANVGHVGIVGQLAASRADTIIYSNSSSRGVFSDKFTLGRWKAFYNTRKGLPVLFFSVKI